MFRFYTSKISRKSTKHVKPDPESTQNGSTAAPSSPSPTPPSTTNHASNTSNHQRTHTSIFSRLFAPKKPAKDPQEDDTDADAATNSPRSPRSPTSLLSLPPSSPSPKSPRSYRPGFGQPPVFQRPTDIGTAGSGVILPKRKDGRDLWTVNDNTLDEEPDVQELLKSQILVTGWLDAAAATAGAGADEDGDASQDQAKKQAKRKSEEQEQSPTPPSPPPKVALHIDTDTHKSPSVTAPAPVVNHVAPAAADNDKKDKKDKKDKVPDLDPSASGSTGKAPSPSVAKPLSVSEEKDTNPPHVGTLLPTIIEPDATPDDEARDEVAIDLPSLSPPPQKKRRHSILARFGSGRFSPLLRRANTGPSRSSTATSTTSTTPTNTSTTSAPERRRTFNWGRRPAAPAPTNSDLARAEEKMVQPTIHTSASISAQIMEIEDEEQQRLADAVFG